MSKGGAISLHEVCGILFPNTFLLEKYIVSINAKKPTSHHLYVLGHISMFGNAAVIII